MNYYLFLGAGLFVYMNLWFILSLVKKRNDIADVAWGLGFTFLAWTSFFISGSQNLLGFVINVMVSFWGIRLTLHIHQRNRFKDEDYRYKAWRKEWGKWFLLRSYFQVYILQGIFLYMIILPVLFINKNAVSPNIMLATAGIVIWLVGYIFESVADRQLADFRKNPDNRGKIMQQGLWRYSRHPNYFGEVLLWWGIFIAALSTLGGVTTIIGPLTITVLILFISGIPLLEKKYDGRSDFEKYKKQTSIFLPLPPRHEK